MSGELEQWKAIAGYEGLYEVSSFGRVMSKPRLDSLGRAQGGVILRAASKDGYRFVMLHKAGVRKNAYVQILVANAFIEKPLHAVEVNHIDFDRSNNRSSNLEWLAHKVNIEHSMRAGRHCHGDNHGSSKITSDDVSAIRKRRSNGESAKKLALEYGLNYTYVCNLIAGRTWKHVA